MKKQHTIWHWTSYLSKGNYSRIGVIHNKSKGVKNDVIRVEMISSKPGYGMIFDLRVDEAMTLIAGLSKTLVRMIYLGEKYEDMFIKSAWDLKSLKKK